MNTDVVMKTTNRSTPARAVRRMPALAAVLSVLLFLTACGGSSDPLGSSSPASGGTGSIVVGSQAYYSNEIVAELYAQSLEKAGYTVDRQFNLGQREVYLAELEAGRVDVIPEYNGNLLEYYKGDGKAKSPDQVTEALRGVLPDGRCGGGR